MATVESQPQPPEHQAPPVPSDAMAVDTSINGAAHHHNSNLPAYSYDQVSQSSLPQTSSMGISLSTPAASDANVPVKAAQEQPPLIDSATASSAPSLDDATVKSASSIPVTVSQLATSELSTSVPMSTENGASDTLAPQTNHSLVNGDVPMSTEAPPAVPAAEIDSLQPEKAEETEPTPTNAPKEDIPLASETPSIAALVNPSPTSADEHMTDISPTNVKVSRDREDDEFAEPYAKRTKTEAETTTADGGASSVAQTTEITSAQTAESQHPIPAINGVAAVTDTTQPEVPAAPAPTPAPLPTAEEWGPMTDAQIKQLKQSLANMKKGRFASSFSKPVDPVALNIPTYFDVIKQPMDLSTIDAKLKEGKYRSVAEFVSDFDLIVDNCIKFNGPNHLISIQGQQLRAQFHTGLRRVPKAGDAAPPTIELKKQSSSVPLPPRDPKPRPSRPSLTSESTDQTFALGANGIPLTRRTSANDGRPKREIHRPPPRDLPYLSAKPKKKKYQMELKFCEHVLSELKKGRYSHLMAPFLFPVDPVALNIPNYHKIVRKPMDFGTISDKLSNGQYENAKEFETDVNLVFENCYKFNGNQHPISQLAKQFQDIFSQEWSQKNSWISHNTPSSAPQSPEVDSESEKEEEESDDEDEQAEEARKAAELKAIHEQMAELNRKAIELANSTSTKKSKPSKKAQKPVKTSNGKSGSRKSGGGATGRPAEKKSTKTKAKPMRALTKKEEMEVCNRMGELTADETTTVYTWIQDGRRSEGLDPLPESPEGAVELTLEAIPNTILHRILGLIHSHDAQSDYRPVSTARAAPAAPYKKKHKPMRMTEQTAAIERVQSQLASFDNHKRSPSDSGNAVQSDDDDDDDSGSESEEE